MSRWSLAIYKKLSPAKKAWKSFITKTQPQLKKFLKNTLPKSIKATTHRLLISLRSFIPSKLRPISNSRRRYPNTNHDYSHQCYHQKNDKTPLYKSFAAIHIDELFEGTTSTSSTKNKNIILRDYNSMHAEAGTSAEKKKNNTNINKDKRVVEDNENFDGDDHKRDDLRRSKSIYSVEDAWNAVVAASPQLRCVDERAEEFIYKVRQDMRLQKEKSIQDLEEMLARSS